VVDRIPEIMAKISVDGVDALVQGLFMRLSFSKPIPDIVISHHVDLRGFIDIPASEMPSTLR